MNTFKFGESEVFTMMDKNDNVWFKGFDIASILGYAKPRNAILNHIDSEDKQNYGVMMGRPDLGRHENNEINKR